MQNNINDVIDQRDDITAAMFAAQLGAELKYVDSQTTERPHLTPPAYRINNPESFLRKSTNPQPSNPYYQGPIEPGQILPTTSLKDLMIPISEDIRNAPSVVQQKDIPEKNAIGTQMELPLKINDTKRPTTLVQWFEHIEQKINDLELKNTLESQRINKSIRDLIAALSKNKRTKNRVKQNLPETYHEQ